MAIEDYASIAEVAGIRIKEWLPGVCKRVDFARVSIAEVFVRWCKDHPGTKMTANLFGRGMRAAARAHKLPVVRTRGGAHLIGVQLKDD